jgi:hypothetical protein
MDIQSEPSPVWSYLFACLQHPLRPLAAEGRGDEARTSSSSRVVEYDVVGAKLVDCRFCIVLPYDSKRKLFTLVREYSQVGYVEG